KVAAGKMLQFELERCPSALPYPTIAESAPAGRQQHRFSLFAVWQGKCSAGNKIRAAAKRECSTFRQLAFDGCHWTSADRRPRRDTAIKMKSPAPQLRNLIRTVD